MTTKVVQLYIINKSGGLIYHHDSTEELNEEILYIENYSNSFILEEKDERLILAFGGSDTVKIGMTLIKINNEFIKNKMVKIKNENKLVFDIINDSSYYPLEMTFCRLKLKTNEKIMFASMFHSVFALSVQISPIKGSSGILQLETTNYNLYCYQTPTGIKFIIQCNEKNRNYMESIMRDLYGIYSDYALKSPFYTMEMPIRSNLFDKKIFELASRINIT